MIQTPAFQKIICWNEDGKSVKIWSFKELELKVLSIAFRHRNYHSFIRQVLPLLFSWICMASRNNRELLVIKVVLFFILYLKEEEKISSLSLNRQVSRKKLLLRKRFPRFSHKSRRNLWKLRKEKEGSLKSMPVSVSLGLLKSSKWIKESKGQRLNLIIRLKR